jgi:hypothetical protein
MSGWECMALKSIFEAKDGVKQDFYIPYINSIPSMLT